MIFLFPLSHSRTHSICLLTLLLLASIPRCFSLLSVWLLIFTTPLAFMAFFLSPLSHSRTHLICLLSLYYSLDSFLAYLSLTCLVFFLFTLSSSQSSILCNLSILLNLLYSFQSCGCNKEHDEDNSWGGDEM
jgi:hypothetical protein